MSERKVQPTGGAVKKSEGNRKDDESKLAKRRQRIAHMYMRGKTQWEIAEIVGISQSQVSIDLNKIKEEWKTQMVADYSTKLDEELAKLDHMERVLWERFERSCEDAETTHKREEMALLPSGEDGGEPRGKGGKPRPNDPAKMLPVKTVIEHTKKGQVGDPRWTEQIKSICEMRLKLIGAFKPEEKGQVNNNNVFIKWDDMYDRDPITDPAADAIKALVQAKSGDAASPDVQQVPHGDPAVGRPVGHRGADDEDVVGADS